MSSPGAVSTALAGRGFSVSSTDNDYRIVLPTLPSGIIVRNSVLLHCDITGRPYKIGDFRAEMQRLGVMGDIGALGAYQMNHLWIITLKTADTKQRLVDAKELCIKDKRCLVVDPDNAEIRMKLHWIPFHVSDESVKNALEPFGRVQEISREKWRAEGFTGVQSTTRLVRLSLKEGVTQERLPHQLKIAGGNVLVVVPGRAPLCLRCKGRGHIRRECRVPWCDGCHRIGHEPENCSRSYATVTQEAAGTGYGATLEMDEEEAGDAARETEPEVPAHVREDKAAVAAADGANTPGEQYGKDAEERASSQGSVERDDVAVVPQDPDQPSGAGSQVTETVDKVGATQAMSTTTIPTCTKPTRR
ncbi:unnamed protein product [Ixodes hexagonus]